MADRKIPYIIVIYQNLLARLPGLKPAADNEVADVPC